MSEEFVGRNEFDQLKEKVDKLEKTMENSENLLREIDKKVDVISEKILNSDQKEELKLQPINTRLTKLEDNQSWLWKTVIGSIIAIVIWIMKH